MSRAETIPIRRPQSTLNEIARLNERITRRAFEIFQNRGGEPGLDLDNWLTAEKELVWKPAIEMSEKDNAIVLNLAVPGIDPKEIQIEATPDDLFVKAETHHEHRQDEGSIYACEFHSGSMFRLVHFPKQINAEKVKAEIKNGILSIRAPLSEEQRQRTVSVDAA
jgi:HSP20 family molecular chaperone IbpA